MVRGRRSRQTTDDCRKELGPMSALRSRTTCDTLQSINVTEQLSETCQDHIYALPGNRGISSGNPMPRGRNELWGGVGRISTRRIKANPSKQKYYICNENEQ